MTQLELQKETEPDPYIIFEYSIRSPYTKDSYFRRLKRFFDAISLEGATFEEGCKLFAEKWQNRSIQSKTSQSTFAVSSSGSKSKTRSMPSLQSKKSLPGPPLRKSLPVPPKR